MTNPKYNVETRGFYTPWNTVQEFNQLKEALEHKRNLVATNASIEYRIVKCHTVTTVTDVKQLVMEKS